MGVELTSDSTRASTINLKRRIRRVGEHFEIRCERNAHLASFATVPQLYCIVDLYSSCV